MEKPKTILPETTETNSQRSPETSKQENLAKLRTSFGALLLITALVYVAPRFIPENTPCEKLDWDKEFTRMKCSTVLSDLGFNATDCEKKLLQITAEQHSHGCLPNPGITRRTNLGWSGGDW